jgi:tRNA G18 (ribose-2'-O)-methylase SpoU
LPVGKNFENENATYQKLKLEELGRIDVETFKKRRKFRWWVLDNVRSMHNVGAAFRTADAFLVEKIIFCGITPKPPHREIHKAALGATESVDWQFYEV